MCSAPRRRGSPSRTNTLRPGGARRDPRCESGGGVRACCPSPGPPPGPRGRRFGPFWVKEGGSDTATRCFRGPRKLAFVRSKRFIHPSLAQVPRRREARGAGPFFLNHTLKHPRRGSRSIWSRTARSGVSLPRRSDRGETRAAAAAWHEGGYSDESRSSQALRHRVGFRLRGGRETSS